MPRRPGNKQFAFRAHDTRFFRVDFDALGVRVRVVATVAWPPCSVRMRLPADSGKGPVWSHCPGGRFPIDMIAFNLSFASCEDFLFNSILSFRLAMSLSTGEGILL
jgi:hypothetical protein